MECQVQGVKIHNVGVFCSGLLWGGDHYMYGEGVPESVREKVIKWTALAKKYGATLPQVALCFAFLPDVVDMCAFGTSRASAVDENVALCGKAVPAALWVEAKEAGLIADFIPLPGMEEKVHDEDSDRQSRTSAGSEDLNRRRCTSGETTD